MAGFEVRLAERRDLDALAALMVQRETFYAPWTGDAAPTVDAARATVEDALFGPRPAGRALLALDASAPLGAAYLADLFPGGRMRRGVFVKDVFVAEAARGRGVGRALIAATVALAQREGADRVELHAYADNENAQRFYARLGLDRRDKSLVWRRDL